MANINKVHKGRRIEKMCADELRSEGYIVWKSIRHKFLNIDLWGLGDVCGVAADGSHVRFIQCKSGYCSNEVKEQMANLLLPKCFSKEIWMYFDKRKTGKRSGWTKEIIQQYIPD